MSYNKKAHLQTNMEAIKIAFALDKEKRRAMEEERAILQQYSGFGGIKCILKSPERKTDWTKSELDLLPIVADLHNVIRENSKDDTEYKRYFSSLKSSILTAFYTPPEVIKAISDALKENGIAPVRFLEPSAGNGAFADAFRHTFPQNETVCFEKDLLTGKILSHLHPNDKIHIKGFEEIENRPDNQFDVVASNIPFGDTAVFDVSFSKSKDPAKRQATRAIHNYFFIKGADTLREGGLLAFITSQGVMNSPKNEPIRKWLMDNTNLVSAIRLPNNLMADNAGTEVGSDLIILQKNSHKISLTAEEQAFIKARTLSNGITVNNYFHDFSRVVQTRSFVDKDLYGKPGMIYLHDGGVQGMAADLKTMLADDYDKRLNKELYFNNAIQAEQYDYHRKSTHELDWEENSLGFDDLFSVEDFTGTEPRIKENTPQQSQSVSTVPKTTQKEPVISLYDLFGFTEEERKQLNTKKKRKKKTQSTQGKPVQLNLFAQPAQNTVQPANRPTSPISPPTPPASPPAPSPLERAGGEVIAPRPYSGVLQEHHRQGSLATDSGQIGFLKERYRDDAIFMPLELNPLQKQKAEHYIKFRDAYHTLYN